MSADIARHKTAITRTDFSRPIKLALGDGLLTADTSFFDYGCGLGDDLRLLNLQGIVGRGWDPGHRPGDPLRSATVVNIGYVVNVIEQPAERQDALRRAWALAERLLIVSARLSADDEFIGATQYYADGRLTIRGTFQKFFDQDELRNWINQTLGIASVAAAPGVFYVFRDEDVRAAFVASRYRRRIAVPKVSGSTELYETHRELLQPLLDFCSERGRIPADDELPNATQVTATLGSVRRAFRILERAIDTGTWQEITSQRSVDLLIYLALARFEGRAVFGKLPQLLQRDVKAFFTTYRRACDEADELLLSIGKSGALDAACESSQIGKRLPTALYVHTSALTSLSPTLRLFEGCALGYFGRIDGANIIKLHRQEPKISYLSYPDFDENPHPALASSYTVHLQTFRAKLREYKSRRNPPILHRKEAFLASDHPLFAKFARLSRLEQEKGLYEDTSRIGTREGWQEVLNAKGYYLKGHRLLRA